MVIVGSVMLAYVRLIAAGAQASMLVGTGATVLLIALSPTILDETTADLAALGYPR